MHNCSLADLFFFQEILWSAETSEQIHSLHTGQRQQVHGHWRCCLYRWVSRLEGELEKISGKKTFLRTSLGTSNWSGDYFIYTGGVSITVNQTDRLSSSHNNTIQQQLAEVFVRDWQSSYSHSLPEILSRYPDQQWHYDRYLRQTPRPLQQLCHALDV